MTAPGVVQRWLGPVGVLKAGGLFEPFGQDVPVYVARQGMRHLAQHMADQVGRGCVNLYTDVCTRYIPRLRQVSWLGSWLAMHCTCSLLIEGEFYDKLYYESLHARPWPMAVANSC